MLEPLQKRAQKWSVMLRSVRRHSFFAVALAFLSVLLVALVWRLWPQLTVLVVRARLTARHFRVVGVPQTERGP